MDIFAPTAQRTRAGGHVEPAVYSAGDVQEDRQKRYTALGDHHGGGDSV